MTPLQVVGLVVGILLLQVIIWVPLVLWIRRRTTRIIESLRAEATATGETLVRGPDAGAYQGSTGGFSRVRGNCVVAVTRQRLCIRPVAGTGFDVPVAQITAVRDDVSFNNLYRSGRKHVIVRTAEGAELGFIVNDAAGWVSAIRGLLPAGG